MSCSRSFLLGCGDEIPIDRSAIEGGAIRGGAVVPRGGPRTDQREGARGGRFRARESAPAEAGPVSLPAVPASGAASGGRRDQVITVDGCCDECRGSRPSRQGLGGQGPGGRAPMGALGVGGVLARRRDARRRGALAGRVDEEDSRVRLGERDLVHHRYQLLSVSGLPGPEIDTSGILRPNARRSPRFVEIRPETSAATDTRRPRPRTDGAFAEGLVRQPACSCSTRRCSWGSARRRRPTARRRRGTSATRHTRRRRRR